MLSDITPGIVFGLNLNCTVPTEFNVGSCDPKSALILNDDPLYKDIFDFAGIEYALVNTRYTQSIKDSIKWCM